MEPLVLNEHNKAEFPPAHTAEHILNQTMVRMFGCSRSRVNHIERKKTLKGLEYLGVKIDLDRNNFGHSNNPIKISTDDSKVAVYMIPTNEELVIAKDTEAIVSKL